MKTIDANAIQRLRETGSSLKEKVVGHLNQWPVKASGSPLSEDDLPEPYRTTRDQLRDSVHLWFNEINIFVLPLTTYDSPDIHKLLRRIDAAMRLKRFVEEEQYAIGVGGREKMTKRHFDADSTLKIAVQHISEDFDVILRIIRTVPASVPEAYLTGPHTAGMSSHVPNTAFILMWMDKSKRELEDVHDTIREIFAEFGISAMRADEIEHQDSITEVVLQSISKSEFLVADLSGERPNVYYEVGYAHALGKRPILFRRSGSSLHFDLSVHNVPEYHSIRELREILRKRLAAITGREPIVRPGT